METNMELIKQILIAINAKFDAKNLLSQLSLDIPDYSNLETFFHTEALFKASFITDFLPNWNPQQGYFFTIGGLTEKGKDLINAINSERWEMSKNTIKEKEFPYILVQNLDFYFPANIDGPLWRYMSLKKLESILLESSLYFCRADLLGDPFEGSAPLATIKYRPKFYNGASQHYIEKGVAKQQEVWRKCTYISCWHNNQIESSAMWASYGEKQKNIALKTTIKRLEDCIQTDKTFILSPIKYINYSKDFFLETNAFLPFIHKQKQFNSDREFRVITDNLEVIGDIVTKKFEPQIGMFIKVNIDKLIENIVVSPYAEISFKNAVVSLLYKYNLANRLVDSDIQTNPTF